MNKNKHFTITCTTHKPVGKLYLIECYAGTFQVAIENRIGQHWDFTNSIHWYFLIPVTQKEMKIKIPPLGRTFLSINTKLLP